MSRRVGNGARPGGYRSGWGLYKKRLPVAGRGKRGGARSIVATNRGDRWFFLYGYTKNRGGELSDQDLTDLRMAGSDYLTEPSELLAIQLRLGQLEEVNCG